MLCMDNRLVLRIVGEVPIDFSSSSSSGAFIDLLPSELVWVFYSRCSSSLAVCQR